MLIVLNSKEDVQQFKSLIKSFKSDEFSVKEKKDKHEQVDAKTMTKKELQALFDKTGAEDQVYTIAVDFPENTKFPSASKSLEGGKKRKSTTKKSTTKKSTTKKPASKK